ncbi:UDP-3-O-(3-hydroxymyristoyl)glucosamine N-acyltransferase [Nisaea acidiphila]|uniref:UDP-3-O-acylglucosamine N-acyltransferase n=1 Tax=Nisaea acidiphila TaxID=1862145 RepID=A0A9J7AVQ0_9PROT|nr:UDP-3-O-(3-hydroxymyristoyl)glucosamine N-acyltransferase [Nisaea acidiphila]UUX50364.1 UDP-3-O-(3-hydroxymyristoyl)glucosamine N-acyltransferase [Nisaea acidiphila]
MADKRFFAKSGSYSIADLAERVGGELMNCPAPDTVIEDVASVEEAAGSDICFVENRRYVAALGSSKAGVCLLPRNIADRAPEAMPLIVSERPRRAFAKIAALFYPQEDHRTGVDQSAHVDPSAELGDGCFVGPGATIGAGAKIGAGVKICANACVGEAVVIGDGTVIGENASVSHALIGARVVIYPGARVGTCGFGFEVDESGLVKMPQLGRAIIEDDVEIGANSCVDRGSGPDTVIGRATMIDNLVQIGHNVQIGKGCIICGQAGIAGSARIGNYVVLAGQVGVGGHLEIGDGVQVAAMSGVSNSIAPGQKVGGMPTVPINDFRRQIAAVKALGRRKSDQENK